MRPNITKHIGSHESKEQEATFIPEENTKELGADTTAPLPFLAKKKKGVGDLLRNSSIQGVKNTGETKFMDIEQYRKYTDREGSGVSNFAFSANHELSRALNQSNWDQAGSVAARIIPNTILEFTGMIGNIVDVEDWWNGEENGEVGNWLNNWAQEQKFGNGDKVLGIDTSIYRENPNKAMDVGDFAWWMENGSALVESATAFVGLGFLTGGVALGSLSRGAKFLEWIKVLGKGASNADTTRKIIQGGAGLANMAALNQAEGIGIATQVFHKKQEELLIKLKQENPNLPDEEIAQMAKTEAAKAASETLWFNRTNMLLNATSAFAFLKTPALARQIRSNPTIAKTFKRSGLEGLQESGEELVNLAAENYGMDGDNRRFEDAFRDTFTMEGLEAATLGFVGGAAQTGLTSIGKELKTNKRPDGSRYSENDLLRERALEQEEANQRWKAKSAEAKLTSTSDLFMTAKQQTELYNAIDKVDKAIEKAEEAGNKEEAAKLRIQAQELAHETFNSKAFHAFSTGTTEGLENFYKTVANLTEEEAQQRGLDIKTYKDRALSAIEKLNSLEKEFNKSNNYLNSVNIYLNRAKLLDARTETETYENAILETERELEKDVADFGVDLSTIKNEQGKVDLNKLSEENKAIVKDLDSYRALRAFSTALNENKKKRERLTKEYSNLISDSYQKQFKEDLKAKKQRDKVDTSKKKADAKKAETSKEATNKTEEFKDKTPVSNTTGKKKVRKTPPVEEDGGDKFTLDNTDEFATKLVELTNRTDLKVDTKLKTLKSLLEGKKGQDTIDEINSAIDYVRNKHGIEPEGDVQADNLKKEAEDFASFLEDNSPLQQEDLSPEESNKYEVAREKINKTINLMESLGQRGVDTKNFTEVAKYLQDLLGKERFAPLFKDIKSIYNLAKLSDREVTDSYEDIFYTAEDKQKAIENNEVIQNASLPEGFYNFDNAEINELSRQARIILLKDQGYTVYKSDTLAFEGLRTVEGHNKLAHLDKKYKTNLTVGQTDTFNILNFIHSKEDISNVLDGNTDEALLDFDQLNVGSKLTFVALNKVVYDDGTIVYKDGKVELNGEVTEQDPNEVAPIGVKLDGVLLDKVFLHTTEWINVENIADGDDVKNQKNKLYEIRKQVLEAGEKGITTKVTKRGAGAVMRNIDGVVGTISERLPNSQIGIGKDNAIYVGNKQVQVINKDIRDGVTYTIFPVNKGKYLAMPVNRTELNENREYIDSMLQAVRLYLKNDPFDERAIQLFDQTGINIVTEAGLREYLDKFIYLPTDLAFQTDEFMSYMEAQSESVSMVRIAGKNLEFGRGAGVNRGVRFLNRNVIADIRGKEQRGEEPKGSADRMIEAALEALDNTLSNNMSINISKNKMGKKFTLPLITETEVNTTEHKYDDFIKDHLTTDLYSHTLSNGKEIYTIQANIEFDDSFAFTKDNKVSEETSNEAIGNNKEIDKIEQQRRDELNKNSKSIVDRVEDYEVIDDAGDTLYIQIRYKKDGSKEVLTALEKNKYGNVAKAGAIIGTTFHPEIYEKITKTSERTAEEANLNGREKKINEKYDAQINSLNKPKVDSTEDIVKVTHKGRTLTFGGDEDLSPTQINPNEVQYNLKSYNILSSDKAKDVFEKGKKNNWKLDKILTELQIPKEQKGILKDIYDNLTFIGKDDNGKDITIEPTIDEILVDLASKYSYTVEVNTARGLKVFSGQEEFSYGQHRYFSEQGRDRPYHYKIISGGNPEEITKEEFDEAAKKSVGQPTQLYSMLTVPGGTNYTENEISTPLIDPIIKGHAQFSTDTGIGWFRSDSQVIGAKKQYEEEVIGEGTDNEIWTGNIKETSTGGEVTQTRRVLELQSDLFQKGRTFSNLTEDKEIVSKEYALDDGDTLIADVENNKYYYLTFEPDVIEDEEGNPTSVKYIEVKKEVSKESFDKLLHSADRLSTVTTDKEKDSPGNQFLQLLNQKGNWVNFFIKSIVQDSIKKGYNKVLFPKGETAAKIEGHNAIADRIKGLNNRIEGLKENYEKGVITEEIYIKNTEELEKQREEFKTQGLEKLAPIEAFYENRVSNILNKLYTVNVITDEFGNQWNEIDLTVIDDSIDLSPLQLTDQQLQEFEDTTPSSLLVPGVPIKTQTAIIDYLSAEIIATGNKAPIEELNQILKIGIEKYNGLLIEGLPVERANKLQEGVRVLEALLNNYNKITTLVKQNLLTYNNLNLNPDGSFTLVENELDADIITDEDSDDNVLEIEERENNRWASESIYQEDAKKTASIKVKNALSHVVDIESFNIVEGERVPVEKTSVFGLPSYILFDEIVNEISGILAFNNYDSNDRITQPTLESMLETLEQWVDAKPYLHNVIKKINEMDAPIQNMLVGVMSKHYTHHILVYKSAKGNYYVNNSDSNNIAAVVQNSWLQNLINSDLILPSETTYTLDENRLNFINSRVEELIPVIKEGDNQRAVKMATAILNDIGIDFDEKTVMSLINNPIDYGNGSKSLLSLFTDSDGAIGTYLNRLNEIKGKDIQEHHPFKNNSALSSFAREIAKRNPKYFSNSFKDVRGRTYYSYSANKFFIDRLRRLKTDKKLLEDLAAQPFSSQSYWVDMMINDPDNFFRYFKYGTFDGSKEANTKGKKLSQMSPAEHEEAKVSLFFSQNKIDSKNGNYIVNVFYPTTSDKGLQPTLSTLGYKVSKHLKPTTGEITDKGIDWLFDQIVQPEINRILAYQANPSKHTTKGYADGAVTFNLIPELNMVKDIFLVEDGVRYLNLQVLNDGALQIRVKEVLRKYIQDLVNDKKLTWEQYGFVENITEDDWTDSGKHFIRSSQELTLLRDKRKNKKDGKEPDPKANLNNAAHNYVVNYLVANVNIMQTMITDPANFFKSGRSKDVIARLVEEGVFETEQGLTRTDVLGYYELADYVAEHEDLFNNMGKRLAGDIAPGTDLAFEPNETFTLAHLVDEESKSASIEYNDKILGLNKKGKSKYGEIPSTDAQEWTTLEEHLNVMVAKGDISKEKAKEILKLENSNKFISAEDLEIILQPMKPVYVNNVFRNGVEHRTYVKSSSFPLIRQLTKGLEIDKIRKAMLRDGVDRVAFGTAIKLGGKINEKEAKLIDSKQHSVNVFDENEKGKVLDKIDLKPAILTLPRAGFKIQQEVPHKEKDTVNDGSQQRKLLTSAVRNIGGFILPNSDTPVTGEEVQKELDKTYNRIFELKYKQLVEEIEYDVENNTVNLAKIQKVLQEEGLKRSYPLYDLEGFKLDNTGEDFIVPLWLNSSSTKVESMLNSIVDNRVRKFKPKGRSYVLGSSTGFRPTIVEGKAAAEKIKELKELKKLKKNEAGIAFDKTWEERGDGQLLNMRVVDGVLQPAEIMIKPRFKDDNGNLINLNKFIDDYGYIDFSKLDASLLEHFAYRIPTQGLNSMSYVKVVGFLPETSGDLFLAPADWTVQMGSDFDVDKIFTNGYNTLYNKETGALSRYEGDNELKHLENYLLDLHFTVLGNPAKEVQHEILKPLDFGRLGEMIDEIYPTIQKQEGYKGGKGLSESYQKFKYLNARAGAIGIGVFSNDSTFNALAQGKGLELLVPVPKEGMQPYMFKLGDHWSNELSNPMTNSKSGRTKTDVIAAYQSLSVDNENEQGLHKLNINSYTFDAIRTLAMSGFEEDVISYFLNQPIIRDYVRLKTLADDNATEYTVADMDIELDSKYPSTMNVEGEVLDISMADLKAGIEGKRNKEQQKVYEIFKEISEHGKVIQSIQSAINTDSAGMGKDLFYAFEKEAQILDLPYKKTVRNAGKLIGQYTNLPRTTKEGTPIPFTKEDVDKLIDQGYIPVTPINKGGKLAGTINFIKPETINGFTSVYALMFNNRLWERFFPYNNSRLNLAFEDIKSITNQTQARLTQNAELNQELFRDAKSFVIASQVASYTDGDLIAERQRLLVDIPDVNMSLGNIVNSIIEGGYTNPFISRLTVDQNKVILPTSVQYQASATENINERALYAAFSNMFLDDTTVLGDFNGIVYTPRKLAQDLVTAQMISGGVQMANQYVKYIPMNYLHSIGFYDSIKKLNFYKEDDFNQEIYTNQHIQHNPQKVLLKKMKDFMELGMIVSEDKGTVTYKPSDESAKRLPRIFSIKNNQRVKGYDLYFKSEDIAGQWVRVNTLGYNDIKEYNPFDENATSIVPDNNTGNTIPVATPPPTDPKAIKEFNRLTEKNKNKEGEELLNQKGATVAEEYQLKSNESFVNKMSIVLDKIIENDRNPYNTLMAREIFKNLGVIADHEFILSNTIKSQGSYHMADKTIKINLNAIGNTNNEKFEKVILEELIHALTKPALVKNENGVINRINGLRNVAIQAIKSKYGEEAWDKAIENIESRKPLDSFAYNIVYPLSNEAEFVGRLFKSKELQEILNNTPSDVEGKSIWGKFLDIISELLNSIGLDIKKGSALEYAMVDIISLINQEAPSSSVQGEMNEKNPVYRTKEWIEKKFNLVDAEGNLVDLPSDSIKFTVDFINTNYEGIQAIPNGNKVIVDYKYRDLLGNEFENPKSTIKANIPQNLVSGIEAYGTLQEARPEIKKALGTNNPHSIDMIEAGFRTRTTRSNTEMGKYKIKVGDLVKHFGKSNDGTTKNVITKITAIHPKGTSGFIENWNKEGWTDEGIKSIERFKDGAAAIEFEILKDEDFSPIERKSDNMPLIRSYQDRIRTIERNIDKAKAREDFQKIEQLTSALDSLTDRYHKAVALGKKERLAQIAIKGKQDMQEVAEFFENEMTVEDTLYVRKILHFWETATDTLFDESERESEKLVALFAEIEGKANYYSDKLVKIEADYMEKFMKKYGQATTIENVFAYFKDINYAQEKTMDISRIDNEMLNSVFLGIKDANIDALDEVRELTADLADLEEKTTRVLRAKGYKGDNLWNIFRQETNSGKLTGHLVSRYNRNFTKPLNTLKRKVKTERDFVSYSKYMEWARNNTKGLKLGYLFPTGKFTKNEQVKVNEYVEGLRNELGEAHFNEFMEVQAKGIEAFTRYKEDIIQRIKDNNNFTTLQQVLNDPKASKELSFWEKANSPYEYYKQLNSKTDESLKAHKNFGSLDYIAPLPIKPDAYDSNFKIIENDATLYEFYKYYQKIDRTLKSFMSDSDRMKLMFSGIPYIEKTIFAAYNEKGYKAGLAPIWGELKKAMRVNNESNIVTKNIDPVSDIEERNLSVNLGRNNKTEIDNYVFNKSIEYKAKTGEAASKGMLEDWYEDIVDQLAQKKSYDLPKILRVYAITVLTYKHKSKVEDYMKLAQNTLNEQKEVSRNKQGEPLYTNEARNKYQYKPVSESFTRTKKQFEYFIGSQYSGANDVEMVIKDKKFTKEEKDTIKELESKLELIESSYSEGKLNATEYITAKKKLEEQIDEIGGYEAWSKRGDMLLKYIQLKGMGWNAMSAIANIGFGTIANVIEGEGGQLYTSKQLRKGYRLTMGSIGRNLTFNKTSPGESKKIRNMMNRWDVLKDASHELFENAFTVQLSKKHKWLSPYNLTARTEYVNQAPLMIALMLNTPVVLDNGEKTNLWEVTTEEGTLKDGVKVDPKTIKKLRVRLDQVIKRNHGNYDPNSPLALKKNFIGRALGQFRTWMFEGVAARFESEKHDAALGIDVKGRYISGFNYFTEGFTPSKVFEFLKAMVKFQSFGKLLKDADFEQFGDPKSFKEVDVANMRRLVAEVVIYIDVYIAYMILASLAAGLDDEEDKLLKQAFNMMSNQGLRLRTDLTFYTNPSQLRQMMRDPLPLLSVVKDTGEWIDATSRLIQGDDEIQSGVNANTSRWTRESAQMLPITTQGYRIFNYGSQVFEK